MMIEMPVGQQAKVSSRACVCIPGSQEGAGPDTDGIWIVIQSTGIRLVQK